MTNSRQARPTRYLVIAGICFILTFLILLLVSCGQKRSTTVVLHDLEVVNGQTVDAWIEDLEENPPKRDPFQSYGFKESAAPWTGWNKFWLGGAIAGQIADGATTIEALGSGNCHEANPFFGEDPSSGLIIGAKLAAVGAGLWLAEYWYAGSDRQQECRNWIYGAMAVVGLGAGAWNAGQDCR
jgi:hypothetical protein